MAHKDTIISYIQTHGSSYCDDCLSKLCNIKPRQTVFQICTKLNLNGKLNRRLATCSYCGKEKKVNSINENEYIDNTNQKVICKGEKESKNIVYADMKFTEIGLEFQKFNINDTFSRFNAHTLSEILIKNKYIKLKEKCDKSYAKYMNMELGEFVSMLKKDGNLFYKEFLNPYGDNIFCKFSMEHTLLDNCKGIYMYKFDGNIMYIGRVKGNFTFIQRVKGGYANISPKNCYIDGQATNCHINSMINKIGGQVKFYVMPLDDDDEEICLLEKKLIQENKPEWNIALK